MIIRKDNGTLTDRIQLQLIRAYNENPNIDTYWINTVGDLLRNADNNSYLNTDSQLLRVIENLYSEEKKQMGFTKEFIKEMNDIKKPGNRFKNQNEEIVEKKNLSSNKFVENDENVPFEFTDGFFKEVDIDKLDYSNVIKKKNDNRFIQSDIEHYQDYSISEGMSEIGLYHKRMMSPGRGKGEKEFLESQYINLHLKKFIGDNILSYQNLQEAFYSEFIKILIPEQYYKVRRIVDVDIEENDSIMIKLTKNSKALADTNSDDHLSNKSLFQVLALACFLGIGDRHDNNILVNKEGVFFNIDFGSTTLGGQSFQIKKLINAIENSKIAEAKEIFSKQISQSYDLATKLVNNMTDKEFVQEIHNIFADQDKLKKIGKLWNEYTKQISSEYEAIRGNHMNIDYSIPEICNKLAKGTKEYLQKYESKNKFTESSQNKKNPSSKFESQESEEQFLYNTLDQDSKFMDSKNVAENYISTASLKFKEPQDQSSHQVRKANQITHREFLSRRNSSPYSDLIR